MIDCFQSAGRFPPLQAELPIFLNSSLQLALSGASPLEMVDVDQVVEGIPDPREVVGIQEAARSWKEARFPPIGI